MAERCVPAPDCEQDLGVSVLPPLQHARDGRVVDGCLLSRQATRNCCKLVGGSGGGDDVVEAVSAGGCR